MSKNSNFPYSSDMESWMGGDWYVQYPDGLQSIKMPKKAAKSYAKIFNGTLVYAGPKTVIDRFLDVVRAWLTKLKI